jgi:AcrR family transcriptional regulator
MPRNLSRRIKVDRAGSSVNLSKERVLRAAVALADKGGIESLSMRKLGQDLGVEAMSLYNYVASKDDLLDSMADFIVGEFDLPSIGTEWKETLRQSAISAHQVLWRHPWACGLNVSRPKVGPAALRYMDSVMDDEYPHITEVARGAIHDHEVEFAFVLDLIIDGLEHVRDNI